MKPSLVILAAGMASRYGSMKQTEGFGPAGETIMEFSIFDAIRAGFGKVVFVIRKEFADAFKAGFEPKLKGRIETSYVYQEMDSFMEGLPMPSDRVKPWGTGHAVLCTSTAVQEPFAVINADDYYGPDAFAKAYQFLTGSCNEKTYAIIGYQLDRTLSEHGTVSRGVCQTGENGRLVAINERTKIYRTEDGRVLYEDNGAEHEVSGTSSVSMNFWCFHPSVYASSLSLFRDFVRERSSDIKAEFFIPIIADAFIQVPGQEIRVIPTSSDWFGVTYKEDAPGVRESVNKLIAEGVYPSGLWS